MRKISHISKKKLDLRRDITIPSFIFLNRDHTILEAVIVFLKERKGLSFRKIASAINRDLRYTYNSFINAKKKQPVTRYSVSEKVIQIPLSVFTKRPALEALVVFLKEKFPLNFHEIGQLLNRDERTVWTVYNRARKKYDK